MLMATALAALAALGAPSVGGEPAMADAGGIQVLRAEAVSEFPDGIRFTVDVQSDQGIDEIVVRFVVGGQNVRQYNYLDVEQRGNVATGEYFRRTGSGDRYFPPGTALSYFFEITDKSGDTLVTEPEELVVLDSRFEWETAIDADVTVYYHGPVEVRARSMADAAVETLRRMGPLLGAATSTPLRIVMYNNVSEMLSALPPRSTTISRELVTEGEAFAEQNVVLLLGSGRRARGTISHELTHVLVHRATENALLRVPLWLNEGLAEYGNLDPGVSYDRFLEWAVDTDRLVPIVYLDTFPGDPNLVLVSYGEARSIVEYMIDTFGADKMAQLLAAFDSGMSFEEAMTQTYGLTSKDLDREWRAALGARPYVASTETAGPPTPEATSAPLKPYTLENIARLGKSSEPEPTPSPTPAAAPSPTPAPTAAPSPTPAPSEASQGGGCQRPQRGRGPVEASSLALLVLPAGALLWRAGRRRLSRARRRAQGRTSRAS